MGINDKKLLPANGSVVEYLGGTVAFAQNITNGVFLKRQLRSGFRIQNVSVYARAYTATGAVDVGFCPVGKFTTAPAMVIATTKPKIKINAALVGISSTIDSNTGLPTVVHKAVTDNISWSTAYTVNVGTAAGQWWGAFRVQMDSAGNVTMRAVSQDQAYATEAGALAVCPGPAVGMIDLGTITIQCATGAAFTCGTTNLDAAGTTVNYNNAATGFTSFLASAIAPVAASLAQGTLTTTQANRKYAQPGALLIGRYTTDGTFAATDMTVDIALRPYPLSGESV